MSRALHRDQIVVKNSSVHGLGVFANRDFAPGELIEDCYVLKCNNDDSNLHDYRFGKTDNYFLALGYGCLYNHADVPNASHQHDEDKKTLAVTVAKPIKKGEEIFIYYGAQWFEKRGLIAVDPTFKSRAIKKIRFYMPFLIRLLKAVIVVVGLLTFVNMFAYFARVFYLS